MVSSSNPRNAIVFYGRVLSSLWSLTARMRINLSEVWFKSTFHVYTGPLRIPHVFCIPSGLEFEP